MTQTRQFGTYLDLGEGWSLDFGSSSPKKNSSSDGNETGPDTREQHTAFPAKHWPQRQVTPYTVSSALDLATECFCTRCWN